jgi:phosphoribosyl 1,2-cyclic phosphate phosphodiesterase
VLPIRLEHGRFAVLGFRVGDLAYCTDVSRIPPESWPLLGGLDTLILDALRHEPHPTHFSLEEALAVIERLKPRRAYLTHLSHSFDHGPTESTLPPQVALAYDGLTLDF